MAFALANFRRLNLQLLGIRRVEVIVRILASEPKADIRWLTFSSDSTMLGTSASEVADSRYYQEGPPTGVEVWDVVTGERRQLENTGLACPSRFCFHPSGQWLIGPGEEGGLVAFDLETNKPQSTKVESKHVTNVAISADGHGVVYYHYERDRSNRGYACREWSTKGELRSRWSASTFLDPKGDSRTFGFILLSDGERILTAEREGSGTTSTFLAFRSLTTGEILGSANIGSYDQPTLAASPDGSTIVVMSKKVLLWFREPFQSPFRTYQSEGKKHFTGVVFHPSGRFLAATSNDETVRLYDTESGVVARTFTWNIGKMRSIVFSPDGALAAAGGDKGQIIVWDVDL